MMPPAKILRWAFPTVLTLMALYQYPLRRMPASLENLVAFDAGGTQKPTQALPLRPNSVRFAIIGDSGSGDSFQKEVAQQMIKTRANFPFEFVVMLGDNIYGGHSSQDFALKFEQPYKGSPRCRREVLRFVGQS